MSQSTCILCHDTPGIMTAYRVFERQVEHEDGSLELITTKSGVATAFRCTCDKGWFKKGRWARVPVWDPKRFPNYQTDYLEVKKLEVKETVQVKMKDMKDGQSNTDSTQHKEATSERHGEECPGRNFQKV